MTSLNRAQEEIQARTLAAVDRWEKGLREKFPVAQIQGKSTLLDTVSVFIENVSAPSKLIEAAIQYGSSRASLPGYTLPQVITDFYALRKAIFEVLEKNSQFSRTERELILDAIDIGIAEASCDFTKNQILQSSRSDPDAAAENSYRKLIDHIDHAIIWEFDVLLDRFTLVSRKAEMILGFPITDWLESSDFLIRHVHPDDQERIFHLFDHAINTGTDQSGDHRIVARDGSELWFRSNIQAEKSPEGTTAVLRGICINITSLKNTEAMHSHFLALSRLDLKQLERERAFRETFVAMLSHDLRTPLTAAKMGAQLLPRFQSNPEMHKQTVERVIKNITRANTMIQDLLDSNQIRSGQTLPLQISHLNLRTVVKDALDELATIHGERFMLEADSEIEGYWDCEELRRLIENLVSNAVKFGTDGSQITVSLTTSGRKAQIGVHNFGACIPLDEQEHIFDPFQRTKTVDTGVKQGWGLGLTLVKGVTEAHGGTVWVESLPDSGTTFTVELPLDSREFTK